MLRFKKQCFVAMLDIMGFKSLVEQDLETTYKLLSRVYKEAKRQIQYKTLDFSIFSDTIIIVSHNDDIESFEDIIISSAHFIRLFIKEGFAINGAITYGDVVYDKSKNICFGTPVSNAHLLQANLFCYGVIVDESAINKVKYHWHKLFSTYWNFISDDIILKLTIPFKKGDQKSMYFVNWLEIEKPQSSYSEQICIAKQQLSKLYNQLPDCDRVHNYFNNTERCLKEWYDFTGQKNNLPGWGQLIGKDIIA